MTEKNKWLVGALAAAVVIGAFFFFANWAEGPGGVSEVADPFTNRPEPAHVAWSDDGIARVEVPHGALPEGVASEDIRIEQISAEEFFGTDENKGRFFAYDLGPDDVEFTKPVTVAITLPLEETQDGVYVVPLVLHKFGEDEQRINVADDSLFSVNREDGTMSVLGNVEHFSSVAVDMNGGMFESRYAPASGNFEVGDSFTFTLTVTPKKKTYVARTWSIYQQKYVSIYDVTLSVANGTRYHISPGSRDTTIRSWKGILSPEKVEIKSGDQAAEKSYVFTQKYTCDKEGEDHLTFVGGMHIAYTMQREAVPRGGGKPSIDRENKRAFLPIDSPTYSCGEGFFFLGAGYTIICGDGTSLSGYYKRDPETHEIITDAAGNGLDYDTGKSVVCPQ